MKFNEAQIQTFRKLGISLIYLFGSSAEGNFLPLSDIDIGVVFEKSTDDKKMGMIYIKLYDVFTDVFAGKKVDIVFLQKATLELRFDVIRHGRILYAASLTDKFNFEEKTVLFYADFKPLLAEFNQSILNRE